LTFEETSHASKNWNSKSVNFHSVLTPEQTLKQGTVLIVLLDKTTFLNFRSWTVRSQSLN